MTTKRKNTIAIVVVLLIWGYVGLKLLDYFGAEDNAVVYEAPAENTLEVLFKKDTFDLYLNYEDPFLRTRPKARRTSSNAGKSIVGKKPGKPKPVEKPKPWPEISFNGMIQRSGSNQPLGMLNIDTRSYLVRAGDYVSGVKVVSLSSGSVELEYNGETKRFDG